MISPFSLGRHVVGVILFFSEEPEHEAEQQKSDDLVSEYAYNKTYKEAERNSWTFEQKLIFHRGTHSIRT